MEPNIFIFPYIARSKSVFALAKALEAKIIKLANSAFVHGDGKVVINWGSSSLDLTKHQPNGLVLNKRSAVLVCANKLKFFDTVFKNNKDIIPEYTTDPQVAQGWSDDKTVVVSREVLSGHSGQGIRFSDKDNDWLDKGKLFVKYIPKKEEYRVHIFKGNVLDIQQKVLRKEDENGVEVQKEHINFRVRSYGNGFIFARNDLHTPECVVNAAKKAFNAVNNLDFGAFDVIWNQKNDKAYVLECNTAPGLTGTTLDNYAATFKKYFKELV